MSVVNFHCMQISLVMSMRFIFGDDWNDAPCSHHVFYLWEWCNFSRIEALEFSCNYTRVWPAPADVFLAVAKTRTKSVQLTSLCGLGGRIFKNTLSKKIEINVCIRIILNVSLSINFWRTIYRLCLRKSPWLINRGCPLEKLNKTYLWEHRATKKKIEFLGFDLVITKLPQNMILC